MFDFKSLLSGADAIRGDTYDRRIDYLKRQNLETLHIETAVNSAIDNLSNGTRSFVIYGEPQSGKTEMMIALTARLLDEGHKYIVILMNDSVALLDQNLTRFKKSSLSTVPVNYKELLDPSIVVKSKSRIIFSKKNASDLKKVIEITRGLKGVVVIDDEADYATPNSKINKDEVSRINELTGKLVENGVYIGVTATPARLDLNFTHYNSSEDWIDFPKHSNYTGQDIFFPTNIAETEKFKLTRLPDENDDPKYLREALFRFLVNSAYLNLAKGPRNFTMLVHTSGKKIDHSQDFQEVNRISKVLNDKENSKREKYFKDMWDIAYAQYGEEADAIVKFIIAKTEVIYPMIMNSDHESDSELAGNPPSPFTIIIGGNSISRGVTFKNLLTMFFTRDPKHSIQQDTYIQRARMFGSRGDVLGYFELVIPKSLYADWRRAFIFHRLSLESRKNGNGIPIWHEGMRIKVAATSSVDTSRVAFDKGEMSFKKFMVSDEILNTFAADTPALSKIGDLHGLIDQDSFPKYISEFIYSFSGRDENAVVVHNPRSVESMDEKYTDKSDISRSRGLVAGRDLEAPDKPEASHHIFLFSNADGEARIVYKFTENISFIKGTK